jgi:hypothetical protein
MVRDELAVDENSIHPAIHDPQQCPVRLRRKLAMCTLAGQHDVYARRSGHWIRKEMGRKVPAVCQGDSMTTNISKKLTSVAECGQGSERMNREMKDWEVHGYDVFEFVPTRHEMCKCAARIEIGPSAARRPPSGGQCHPGRANGRA